MSDTALIAGRPLRFTVPGIAWLERQSAAGRTQGEMAQVLGCSQAAVARAIKRDPAAEQAYQLGAVRAKQSAGQLVVPPSQGRALAITAGGLDCIREMAGQGASQRAIAAALRIDHRRFGDALEAQPEARQALEDGHARLAKLAVSNLIKASNDGSIAATIFLCKNVAGMTDTGPKDGGRPTTNITITLPGAMSREQYLASIETTGVASDE